MFSVITQSYARTMITILVGDCVTIHAVMPMLSASYVCGVLSRFESTSGAGALTAPLRFRTCPFVISPDGMMGYVTGAHIGPV